MKLKITTSEITVEFEHKSNDLGYMETDSNKHLLDFLKEAIQKAAEETIKIKNR